LAAESASAPSASPSCSRTTCSSPAWGVPATATTRARWRTWWASPGAASWCRYRALRVSRPPSMRTSRPAAASV
jgi:hypothetical protein